ncbi:MAG: DNA polymerase [Candidatus Taylorbacteria bacterium]|nr:DNA polymerase [Candidatus Taylorbacteria bacterium]
MKEDTKKRLVLLDSHAILHRAYHALPDFVSAKGEPTGALYGLTTMLIKIIDELAPDYLVACYDLPGPTFRNDVYKDYKAGRVKADDDLVSQMKRSRDIFKAFNIPIYDKPGFEADDMLGTIVEKMKNEKDLDIVVASGDMDTLQLVVDKKVRVYTLKKGIKDTIIYDEDGVNERYGFGPLLLPDYKGLRGDPSDNIIGIKGIGEKTATILIKEFGGIEDIYKALEKKGPPAGGEEKFKKVGITDRIVLLLKEGKEEAEFSKMLATIRRDAPIDFILPKNFKEGIDLDKISALFSDLDFRTLLNRLKSVLGFNNIEEKKEEIVKQDIPKEKLVETSVALWLINSNLTDPTLEDITNFAKTEDFFKASEIIFSELDKRGLRKVYDGIEAPIIPIIEKMDTKGVKIDVDFLAGLSKTYHTELSKLEKKIWEHAGVEFNINSPKQLGEIIFDKMLLTAKGLKKTTGGARSTRESELEKLRDAHPMIPLLFEYRELQKLLSTYIDTIPTLVDDNNRLHAHFLQAGSTTGRMASKGPGLQNIPIKTELGQAIRKAFISEKGFCIASFDYSQVELRIAAFLSADKKLIDIFTKGEDVHNAVASEVFEVPLDKVDREMRRKAKVINFGILYGMGVNALRQNLGPDTPRADAQKFYNDYFEKFSGLAHYLEQTKAEAKRKGYTETFFGRRRYFEGIDSKIPFIRAMAERMAINAPIQGTSADIIKIAMKRVDDYLISQGFEKDVYLILQVHDELVYEIRENLVDKIVPEIRKIMEGVIDPKDIFGIKLAANSAVGRSWGELT